MTLISGRLKAIFWKEFIQMRRDRGTLRMMLVVPVMQLLLFGFAISTDVRNLPTAVFDQSHSLQSRTLVQRFESTGNFKIRDHADSYEQAIRLVNQGRARAAIVIPEDYARSVKRGRPTQV